MPFSPTPCAAAVSSPFEAQVFLGRHGISKDRPCTGGVPKTRSVGPGFAWKADGEGGLAFEARKGLKQHQSKLYNNCGNTLFNVEFYV